jgi:leucyl/phenylalanyl-tRNA--protein transferase
VARWPNRGGLYGIDLGHIFCGESMFSKVSNAVKSLLLSASFAKKITNS